MLQDVKTGEASRCTRDREASSVWIKNAVASGESLLSSQQNGQTPALSDKLGFFQL